MVALAHSRASLSDCLINATTGHPFIFEGTFFPSLVARINFGTPTTDPVRYPDDRVWESNMARMPNFLVDVALATAQT
ncbi:hypothetical protein OsJ_10101 [Oryza sativa Japonica Group]|jgi:hypothetical protein|nr:hypothetical protein OsJ_10101 [Oryza sativa Japonica Group]